MNGLRRRIAALLGVQVAARAFCGHAPSVKRNSARASCGSICHAAKRTRIHAEDVIDDWLWRERGGGTSIYFRSFRSTAKQKEFIEKPGGNPVK